MPRVTATRVSHRLLTLLLLTFGLLCSATCRGMVAGGARADLLGTYPHPNGTVCLMTDLCRDKDPSAGQRARQTVGGREHHGCWGVDRAGNRS